MGDIERRAPPGSGADSISGAITGRPTASGTSSVTVKVTDSGVLNASATQTYSIVIAAVTAVTVAAQTLLGATASGSYLNPLIAGGGAPPYAWVVVTGTVPPGLALTTSGALQGVANRTGLLPLTRRRRTAWAVLPQTMSPLP